MRVVAPELAAVGFFVIVGWLALWPARRALGSVGYHIAALPTGLLSAVFAAAIAALAARPLDLAGALVGAGLFVAVVQAFLRGTRGSTGASGAFDRRSFLVAAGVMGLLAAVVGVVRLTVSNNDSIVSYWPLGVQLSRTGEFSVALIARRSALIPGMNAIHVDFGSDWAYVIYPMLGATMLAWLAFTLVRGPLRGSGRRTATMVAGVAVGALAIEPSFIYHSLFVHSHMISGLYLLMALTSLWLAAGSSGTGDDREAGAEYLVLAGLSTAGLAHGRPDGLAYLFVPVVAAIAVLTTNEFSAKRVLAYFGPLLSTVGIVYLAAYARLGMWESGKLGGRTSLAILAVLALSAAGPWIVRALERATGVRLTGERFFSAIVGVSAIATAVVLGLKWDAASSALANARVNLFQGAGGYHYLWYAVVGLLVLSLFTRDALRPGSWTRPAFLSVALFFAVALVVHGTSHEGRIGYGDSFNRVAFHALPVFVWFVAAVVARILTGVSVVCARPGHGDG